MGKKKEVVFSFFLIVFVFILIFSIFSISFIEAILSSEGNISFAVSVSKAIVVIRDTFNGNTTDFVIGGNSALENLIDMTLEKTSYGKIVFSENINLTQDAYGSTGGEYGRTVDLDSNFEISSNYLIVNANDLSSLNKSVIIYFYGLSFDEPAILRNGVDCPSSVCNIISYTGGTLIFTVESLEYTSFTSYSSKDIAEDDEDEDDDGDDDDGGGSGGGGGGEAVSLTSIYDFEVEPEIIEITMNKGDASKKKVTLINNGNKDLVIQLDLSEFQKFIRSSKKLFVLKKGESLDFDLEIFGPQSSKADVYLGKIYFNAGQVNKSLEIIFDLKGELSLFDIQTTVLKKYITPGSQVPAKIKIKNLGEELDIEVELEYSIKNFENEVIVSNTEFFNLNESFSKNVFLKSVEDFETGYYLLYSKVSHQDKSASSYDTFIVERISSIMWFILLLMIGILIFIVIFTILKIRKEKIVKEINSEK